MLPETRPADQLCPAGLLRASSSDPGHDRTLLRFDFEPYAGSESNAAGWPIGLDCLGGDLTSEFWSSGGPVVSGVEGSIHWRRSDENLALALVCPDDIGSDPEQAVFEAYRDILALASRLGRPHLLRAWNYLPAINDGTGDRERYRRFCLGRARALEASNINGSSLCAGTAIGSDEPRLRVYVLCGNRPGVHIENPRQVSAYEYPRRYGPRSPSFARATAVPTSDGQVLLMISGTASVVGHETRHPGNVVAQTEEILVNLKSLLIESAQRMNCDALRHFDHHSMVRVYVREAEHWSWIADRLARAWPNSLIIGMRGDICRSDLLVEIEAVTTGYPTEV